MDSERTSKGNRLSAEHDLGLIASLEAKSRTLPRPSGSEPPRGEVCGAAQEA
jgi:hypothetical protein